MAGTFLRSSGQESLMRAVGLDYATRRLVKTEICEPRLEDPAGVLFRIEQVGVCATDRELARFHFGHPPEGMSFLVLGHEVLGTVVEAGPAAAGVRVGDRVVAAIRRACLPACDACSEGRRDLCRTGLYKERGIFGLDGYFTEFAVDAAVDLLVVPPGLADVAVLAEPLSVVEKAIGRALDIRGEFPRTALVLGAGPIGLLSVFALLARGVEVTLSSLEPRDHFRARLAMDAGARYLESPRGSEEKFDLALEATGSVAAAYEAIRSLGRLGVCAVLGGSAGSGRISFSDLLVNNQVVFGSVNANRQAFEGAILDLERFDGRLLRRMIRQMDFSEFETSILGTPSEVPKLVHVIH
jgi:threonine dehydrogenase-like Zn-dependent dehydrogenase